MVWICLAVLSDRIRPYRAAYSATYPATSAAAAVASTDVEEGSANQPQLNREVILLLLMAAVAVCS